MGPSTPRTDLQSKSFCFAQDDNGVDASLSPASVAGTLGNSDFWSWSVRFFIDSVKCSG